MKKIILLISAVCLMFIACMVVFSASQSDLNEIRDEKAQLQKELDAARERKAAAQSEYDKIEADILAIQAEINIINAELNNLNGEKDKITTELNAAIEKEKNQEDLLRKRLRVMHEEGATSYLNVLLSSDSVFDYFYNMERLSQITEYDNNILKELTESKKLIEAKKQELESVIAEVEVQKNAQVGKRNELQAQSDLKVSYMKELENDIEKYKANYEKAEAEEARIRAEIAAAANRSAPVSNPYSGGQLQWPTPGAYYITSPYGYRIHPIFGSQKFHRGVDISVGSGNQVLAAESGVVIKATYNSSYGNYVSINHGGGLVTLYAHNSSLCVSVGQTVSRGQLIAYSGNTGNSTGPHLHYEVMMNGQTTDPMSYY